ncbi:hypothetical protein [Rhodococcus qingshengii]|uniref:hypothetical protein n=1 Tax=Rhodococcus qingshengii TaxID=334542 RepID=UPI0035DBCA55
MDSRGITNHILLEIDRSRVFRVAGPFQNEMMKTLCVNQSAIWFTNDYALSVCINDYEEEVHTAIVGIKGFRMLDTADPEWVSPFEFGWDPIVIPGEAGTGLPDGNVFTAVEMAKRIIDI